MPKITIVGDQGGEVTTVEIDNSTSYAVGLGIEERASLYIDPNTGKPYEEEAEIHQQLSSLEEAFKSVIKHERSS